ncbi:dactylin [Anaeramoeba ignava]|uniref:Dactylin n=1 Tax=Anaeramoeba ignava TaxID=1746090 RepID=A0A9Q0LX98_ANAIG|nr:dactylin [Anaeramoeba ignava]
MFYTRHTTRNQFTFSQIEQLITKKSKMDYSNKKIIPNQGSESGDPFQDLPDELMLEIFSYLEKPFELGICCPVNNQFARISNDYMLWKEIFRKYSGLFDYNTIRLVDSTYFEIMEPLGIEEYFNQNSEQNQSLQLQIEQQPKKLFNEQIKKFLNLKKQQKKRQKAKERQKKLHKTKLFLTSPGYVTTIFCLILISVMFACSKFESYFNKSYIFIVLPALISLAFLLILTGWFVVFPSTSIVEKIYSITCFALFFDFFASLLLLGLTADHYSDLQNHSWIFFVCFALLFSHFVLWIFLVIYNKHEIKIVAYNQNLFHQIHEFWGFFSFPFFLSIVFLLVAFQKAKVAMIFLICSNIIPWILFCIFRSQDTFLFRDLRKLEIPHLVISLLAFATELMMYFRLFRNVSINWILISLPITIPLFFFCILLCFCIYKECLNHMRSAFYDY